jgi:hypothetical protein
LWVTREIELVDHYCKNWNLECNLRKSKIMVYKKRGKLKVTEKWRMNGLNTEVLNKFNYLEVMYGSTGGWNKQIMLVKTTGYEALIPICKCLSVIPSVKVHTRVVPKVMLPIYFHGNYNKYKEHNNTV